MKAQVIARHAKLKVWFVIMPGAVVGGGVNLQGSRDTARGSWGAWSAFVRQGKLIIAHAEPEKLLG